TSTATTPPACIQLVSAALVCPPLGLARIKNVASPAQRIAAVAYSRVRIGWWVQCALSGSPTNNPHTSKGWTNSRLPYASAAACNPNAATSPNIPNSHHGDRASFANSPTCKRGSRSVSLTTRCSNAFRVPYSSAAHNANTTASGLCTLPLYTAPEGTSVD